MKILQILYRLFEIFVICELLLREIYIIKLLIEEYAREIMLEYYNRSNLVLILFDLTLSSPISRNCIK